VPWRTEEGSCEIKLHRSLVRTSVPVPDSGIDDDVIDDRGNRGAGTGPGVGIDGDGKDMDRDDHCRWSQHLDRLQRRWRHRGTAPRAVRSVPGLLPGAGVHGRGGDLWWYRITSSPWNNNYYASADSFFNGGDGGSPLPDPIVDPKVRECAQQPERETTGSSANTWSDFKDAGGTAGEQIADNQTVAVTCRTIGFIVSDGNRWWYRIASSPWDDEYYASADAFYNNGQTSGSLIGTPFYDPKIKVCRGTTGPYPETTGGTANTWTDYKDAGGTAGKQIADHQTVDVTCRVKGFKVADGNKWWYEIASSPWDDDYYVSADAFYNNGDITGSLIGTPFYDPAVPVCSSSS
jgi:hypothetical protein